MAVAGYVANRYRPVAGLWRFVSGDAISSQSGAGHRDKSCRIKGNINLQGERIYHLPGQPYYDATRIDTLKGERWFCTEAQARAAGWRKARGY